MADNNLARSRNDLPDFFADDDPLAELARIVGYEDRPAANAAPVSGASMQRREPALNLEDELLREFERYDAPPLDPLNDIAIDGVPLVANGRLPSLSDSAALSDQGFVRAEPADIDFPPESAPFEGDVRGPEVSSVVARSSVSSVAEIAPPLAADVVPSEPEVELQIDEFDLAAELENSIGAVPVSDPQPEVKAEVKPKGYVPGFRMPLANFNLARTQEPASNPAPSVPASRTQPIEAVAFPAESDQPAALTPAADVLPQPFSVAAPVASASFVSPVVAASVLPSVEPAAAPAAPEAVSAGGPFSALDELIQDVERYSLPSGAERPAASPAVKVEQPASVPVVAAPPVEALAPQVQAPAQEVSAAAKAVEEKDPFADEEFELALDDLELDLAELVVEEVQVQPVKADAPEVAKPEPIAGAQKASVEPQLSPVALAAMAQAEVKSKPEPAEDLPFDAAQIADSEDQVEAIAELDVPAMPAEEPEQPPVYRQDYDLDIDAELATLLMAPEKVEPAPVRKPEIDIAAASQAGGDRVSPPARPVNYTDLDEFERALEEDFRRSLSAPLPAAEQEELHYADADYVATVENARRSAIGRWAVPLVVAGVVVLGGVGAYAWLGSEGPGIASNGEPVVIAADTDPVKVAPENPGGKTVPNQDKAVYDRVAGVSPQDPKQQTLISSSEEPVDVVQKTLMPDMLPLEGENDIELTDVAATTDARLLPQEGGEQEVTSQDQQPVAIMPRKVKTMIVRPDGTLVEQEVPAPALAAPDMEKVPAAGTKPAELAAASQDAGIAAPAAPIETTSVPAAASAGGIVPASAPVVSGQIDALTADPIAPATDAPADADPALAAAAAAELPVEAGAEPAMRAPIPVARPAEQPVNVVAAVTDQGNVRAPAQSASQEVASAPAQTAPVGEGGYLIQIASLPTQADAQKSYQNLSAKFGSVIGGRGVDIKAAEIAGKGTFYRVRIPAGSKSDAVALCERYRAAGGSCLVAR